MKTLAALLTLALVTACSPTIQNTSGAAFLAARDTAIDPEIAAAAAIEPDLQFPARIGIGRIGARRIEAMSVAEETALDAIQPNAARIGTFVPLDTFHTNLSSQGGIHAARLAAAKQHLDYVLLYKLTQDGRGFGALGRADVYFVDVRNGYVYGRTTAEANLTGLGHVREGWGEFSPSDEGAVKLINAAMPDVVEMLNSLVAKS